MLKVVSINSEEAERQAELVATLTKMLEEAKAGTLTELVCMSVRKESFRISRCSSTLLEALAYCAMMQDTFVTELKRPA